MSKKGNDVLDYTIDVDAFKEGTQDGVTTYTYPIDHLQEVKKGIFGEEKLKQYEDAEAKFFKDMGDAIAHVAASELENENSKELLVKFQAAQEDCELYIKRDKDQLDTTFRAKSYRNIDLEELKENIWDAVSTIEGNNE